MIQVGLSENPQGPPAGRTTVSSLAESAVVAVTVREIGK